MKVILSYGNYFNHGKNYQIKFNYENQEEVKTIKELMDKLQDTNSFNYYYLNDLGNISLKPTDIYGGTDIPKSILHPFISMLLLIKNVTVIIGSKEFTSYETNKISEAIDNLHINATLCRDIYFGINSTYYLIFKYTSNEQRDELSNELHTKFCINARINSTKILEEKENIMPFLVNSSEEITDKNTDIIGGIKIPRELLKEYIKTFIEDYNMIINIGCHNFKEKFDDKKFDEALSYIEQKTAKVRKKTKHIKETIQ